jgi:glycosyltransferase involved in cell wall biosynthesis
MSDSPLRILSVAPGRSIHTLRWARRLVDLGHEVHLVSAVSESRSAEISGATMHDIRRLDWTTRISGLRRWSIGPAIARLARELEIDVTHAHNTAPQAFWAARAGIHPLVVSPWGRDVLVDAATEPGRTWAAAAFAAADWTVVNSVAIAEAAVSAGADPDRLSYIIWHAQTAGFDPAEADHTGVARELGLPEDALIVMSLRNFQDRTNIDVLVRAFARLHRDVDGARLVLAARAGQTRAKIEQLVADLGIEQVVRFHRVEPEGLPRLVASADIVVSIADTDSSPASLLEAMASGRPLVAGWCPSIDEWVGAGDGAEMVECRDEEAVYQALSTLAADAGMRARYGARNVRVVSERLGEAGPALVELYRALIARTPPPSRPLPQLAAPRVAGVSA